MPTAAMRVARWSVRYLRMSDIIGVAMVGIALAMGIAASKEVSSLYGVLLGVYIVLVLLNVIATAQTRSAVDKMHGQVFWGLCHLLNANVLGNSNRTRFTFFGKDPLSKFHIIPLYRYRKGGDGPVKEASRSNARYKIGEGITGRSWTDAGEGEMFFAFIPEFHNRDEFEEYYSANLGLSAATAKTLSDHTMHVRGFFSAGFSDTRGVFLGVLSIDFQDELRVEENGNVLLQNGGNTTKIDSSHLHLISTTIRSVLRSFSQAEHGK